MIQVSVIQFGEIQIGVIQIFAPVFSNFENILTPTIFENSIASGVFSYRCIMSRQHAPVEKIQLPPEGEF